MTVEGSVVMFPPRHFVQGLGGIKIKFGCRSLIFVYFRKENNVVLIKNGCGQQALCSGRESGVMIYADLPSTHDDYHNILQSRSII